MHFLKSWRSLSMFSQTHNNSLCRACGADIKEHSAVVGFLNASVNVSRAAPSWRNGLMSSSPKLPPYVKKPGQHLENGLRALLKELTIQTGNI